MREYENMPRHNDMPFFVSILNTKTNKLEKIKCTLTRCPDEVTYSFECDNEEHIIIGVTDDREVFTKNKKGEWGPI